MIQPVRVVHYVNQFFAGIGGEEMAHVGISLASEVVGGDRDASRKSRHAELPIRATHCTDRGHLRRHANGVGRYGAPGPEAEPR